MTGVLDRCFAMENSALASVDLFDLNRSTYGSIDVRVVEGHNKQQVTHVSPFMLY